MKIDTNIITRLRSGKQTFLDRTVLKWKGRKMTLFSQGVAFFDKGIARFKDAINCLPGKIFGTPSLHTRHIHCLQEDYQGLYNSLYGDAVKSKGIFEKLFFTPIVLSEDSSESLQITITPPEENQRKTDHVTPQSRIQVESLQPSTPRKAESPLSTPKPDSDKDGVIRHKKRVKPKRSNAHKERRGESAKRQAREKFSNLYTKKADSTPKKAKSRLPSPLSSTPELVLPSVQKQPQQPPIDPLAAVEKPSYKDVLNFLTGLQSMAKDQEAFTQLLSDVGLQDLNKHAKKNAVKGSISQLQKTGKAALVAQVYVAEAVVAEFNTEGVERALKWYQKGSLLEAQKEIKEFILNLMNKIEKPETWNKKPSLIDRGWGIYSWATSWATGAANESFTGFSEEQKQAFLMIKAQENFTKENLITVLENTRHVPGIEEDAAPLWILLAAMNKN